MGISYTIEHQEHHLALIAFCILNYFSNSPSNRHLLCQSYHALMAIMSCQFVKT